MSKLCIGLMGAQHGGELQIGSSVMPESNFDLSWPCNRNYALLP